MKSAAFTSVKKDIKQFQKDLTSVTTTCTELIGWVGPTIQDIPEGREIISKATSDRAEMFKLHADLRLIDYGRKQKGWWDKHIAPLIKLSDNEGWAGQKDRIREQIDQFFSDVATTSYRAAKLRKAMDKNPFADPADNSNVVSGDTVNALVKVAEPAEGPKF